MRQFSHSLLALFSIVILLGSCKSSDKKKEGSGNGVPSIKEETISYKVDSLQMNSYMVYDENREGKRPAILVIHEWWGLNDYVKMMARKLAELGYIAIAVDMYGNGKMGNDPATAGGLATPFYQNTAMAKKHIDAAMEQFKKNEMVDTANMAIMGYCFGGAMSIIAAQLGANLKGAVSFHGNLNVVPVNKDLLKAEILVCHGNADQFVPQAEVNLFRQQMDSLGLKYEFKGYDSATHAFTNPEATAMGQKFNIPIAYNAKADSASWEDMKQFFKRIFK